MHFENKKFTIFASRTTSSSEADQLPSSSASGVAGKTGVRSLAKIAGPKEGGVRRDPGRDSVSRLDR